MAMEMIHPTLGEVGHQNKESVVLDNIEGGNSYISLLSFIHGCGLLFQMFTLGGIPIIKIDYIQLDNNITCLHNSGRNIQNNTKSIITNKRKK